MFESGGYSGHDGEARHSLIGVRPRAAGFEAQVEAVTRALRALALGEVALERDALRVSGDAGGSSADAQRIDAIAALEALKDAACAAQARLSAEFAASQRAAQRETGVPADRCGRGVAAQVALARGESPHQGGRLLGLAEALVKELPCTMRALAHGGINEWRATLVARESACLSVEDRAALDREVCGDLAGLAGVGDRTLVARARAVAQRLDAAALVRRARRAESERTVTIRPAPDAMTYVTALLPLKDGVAVYAALRRAAEEAISSGAASTRGAAMADALTARITGREASEPVPVQVGLVMTDAALFAPAGLPGADEPATVLVPGGGEFSVPAQWARELLEDSDRHGVGAWFRRLFADPSTGALAAMDSQSRCAPPNLSRFIRYRDRTCRTPWCDAPIRHIDHVDTVVDGGETDSGNLQGLCEACNHAKQASGWQQEVVGGGGGGGGGGGSGGSGLSSGGSGSGGVGSTGPHVVETRTPTGHRYSSTAPPLRRSA